MGKVVFWALVVILLLIAVAAIFAGALIGGGGVSRRSDLATGQFGTGLAGTAGGDLANGSALTAQEIAKVLGHFRSPIEPFAEQIAAAVQRINVNPLLSLAIMQKDSSMGKVGRGACGKNNNPGNVKFRADLYRRSGIEALPKQDEKNFALFKTCGDGAQAKIWLLRTFYLDKGLTTVDDIIEKYAPRVENDTDQYIADVKRFMVEFKRIAEEGTR